MTLRDRAFRRALEYQQVFSEEQLRESVVEGMVSVVLNEASGLIGIMADNLDGAIATLLRDLADEITGVKR